MAQFTHRLLILPRSVAAIMSLKKGDTINLKGMSQYSGVSVASNEVPDAVTNIPFCLTRYFYNPVMSATLLSPSA